MKKIEENLQLAASKYLSLQYPQVIFTSEASGMRVPMGLAVKLSKLRSMHRQVDFSIDMPKLGYHGIRIDFKKETVFKKDGGLKKELVKKKDGSQYDRLEEQLLTLMYYNKLGYYGFFCWSFDVFKAVIDGYMNNNKDFFLNDLFWHQINKV